MEVGVYRNLTHPQNVLKKREKVNMTDNLIERLRGYCDGNNDLMDAAANRIEKLETALEKIIDTDPDEGTSWFHDIARKALEGKDD
jgi:hypothetical protein